MENLKIKPERNEGSGSIFGNTRNPVKKKQEAYEDITSGPVIPEKDEVKNAEERMRQEKKEIKRPL